MFFRIQVQKLFSEILSGTAVWFFILQWHKRTFFKKAFSRVFHSAIAYLKKAMRIEKKQLRIEKPVAKRMWGNYIWIIRRNKNLTMQL